MGASLYATKNITTNARKGLVIDIGSVLNTSFLRLRDKKKPTSFYLFFSANIYYIIFFKPFYFLFFFSIWCNFINF
jgi:hypothetical protein